MSLVESSALETEVAKRTSLHTILYSQCWEDADVLVAGLDVQPGDRCLSIASAGDNTLALLTRDPEKVLAVDLDAAQLACLDIRVAALRTLSHKAFLELLGSRPSIRRHELYQTCRPEISSNFARGLWDDLQPQLVRYGVGGVGRFERYWRIFRQYVLPLIHRRSAVAKLLSQKSEIERRQFYEDEWNNWRWRGLIRLFASRPVLSWLGREPAFFKYVDGSTAEHFLRTAAYGLTEISPAQNPLLHWILTGRHGDALPVAYRPEHFDQLRDNLPRLEWRQSSVEQAARDYVTNNQCVDKFNLSDIFEYMSVDNQRSCLAGITKDQSPRKSDDVLEHDGAQTDPAGSRGPHRPAGSNSGGAQSPRQWFFLPWFTCCRSSMSPNLRHFLLLLSLSIVATCLAHWLSAHRGLSPEARRKSLHVTAGVIGLSMPWLFDRNWPVCLLTGLLLAALASVRWLPALRSRLGDDLYAVRRNSVGELLLPVAIATLFWLADGHTLLYFLPLLILTTADVAAALVASRYGLTPYQTYQGTKTWEGTIIFLSVAFLATISSLLLLSEVGRVEVLLISCLIGLVGCIIEATTWRGVDNLFIPLGTYFALKRFLRMSAPELAGELAVVIVIMLIAVAWARRTRLTTQANLAAVLVAFLLWSVGGPMWIIPALSTFLLHPLLTQLPSQASRSVDPRAVFSVSSCSIFWMALHRQGLLRLDASLYACAVGLVRALLHDFVCSPLRAGWIEHSLAITRVLGDCRNDRRDGDLFGHI